MKRKFLAYLLTLAMLFNIAMPYGALAADLQLDDVAGVVADSETDTETDNDATDEVAGDTPTADVSTTADEQEAAADEPAVDEPAAADDDEAEYDGKEVKQPAAVPMMAGLSLDEPVPAADEPTVQLNQKHLIKTLKFGKANDLKEVPLQNGVYTYDVYLPADQTEGDFNVTRADDTSSSTTMTAAYTNTSGQSISKKITSGRDGWCSKLTKQDMNGATLTITVTDGDYQTVYTLNVKRTIVLDVKKITDAAGDNLATYEGKYLLVNGEKVVKITANAYGADLTIAGKAATSGTVFEHTVTAAVGAAEDIEIKAAYGSETPVVSTISVRATDATTKFSGKCGPTATWELVGDTLTIGGSGAMNTDNQWFEVPTAKGVKTIVVGDEITSIANGAFVGCSACTSVTIGSKVTSIGVNAFSNCKSITSIVLPADLQSIGGSAFNGCTGITEITIPNKVGTIGASAFAGCTGLTKIELPDSVSTIGDGAFSKCSALKSAKLPGGLTEIPKNLFSVCSALETVNIPADVTKIGGSSFLSCKNLASVTLPNKVTTIDSSAFSKTGLVSIVIPNSVTTIGTYAFSGCEALKDVTMSAEVTNIGNYTFQDCTALETISGLGKITSIGNYLFDGCIKLKTVDIPDSVTTIGTMAFKKCKALNNITLPDGLKNLGSDSFKDCISLTEIAVPGNITSIPGSFNGCTGLTKVTLPDGLTEIGSSSFNGCAKLAAITIPSGVTKIGSNAFNGCAALTKVEVPAGAVLGGNKVFINCTGLKEVSFAKMDSRFSNFFEGCTALEKVTFLEGATTFGRQTFGDSCTALKEVVVPTTLTDWGTNAFGKEALANIKFTGPGVANFSFGDGVIYNKEKTAILYLNPKYKGEFVIPAEMTELQAGCFKDCVNITKFTFEEGSKLTAIPSEAFAGCTSLTEVVLPDSVTSVGGSAFAGCTSLSKLTLSDNITTIGVLAFENCSGLTELKLPAKLTDLGWSALKGAAVRELVVPEGVTTLQENQFGECEYLEKIEIKGNVTSIPKEAFKPSVSLKTLILPASVNKLYDLDGSGGEWCFSRNVTIYFKGSASDWLKIDNKGTKFQGTVICNYVEPTTEDGKLVVDTYPENIVAKVNTLADKKLSLTLKYPEGYAPKDGDKITADWYYATTAVDGVNGLKLLRSYSFDKETMTATVSLSEQAAQNKLASWAYYLVAFKTDTDGNTTMFVSRPINVLGTTGDFSLTGEGSYSNPFNIGTYADLKMVADMVDSGTTFNDIYFKLTADIEVPATWNSMGTNGLVITGSDSRVAFRGNIDGDGHTLTFLNDGTTGAKPLFRCAVGATVENLNLKGVAFEGAALADSFDGEVTNCKLLSGTNTGKGGLVQTSGGVTMTNCVVESGVRVGWNGITNTATDYSSVGSLLSGGAGSFVSCKSAADVYGKNNVGGLVGVKGYSMRPAIVKNSEFTGTVTATGEYVGGIVGRGYDNFSAPNGTCVRIENCLVNASISGGRAVGGVFGGEGGVEQAWDNGIGYIRNNMFFGSIKLTDANFGPWVRDEGYACPADNIDGTKGGIIGFMRNLNSCTIIENNYFYDTNGTTRGIGGVEHIDTTTHTFGFDETDKIFYYDTARDDLDEIKNWVDREDKDHEDWKWTSVLTSGLSKHRTDDPMGKDADKLAKAMTATQMADGTVKALLNTGDGSWNNWVQSEGDIHPLISEASVPYKLEISGDYKTEYYIGDELDMSGATFTVTWTNGRTTTADLKDIVFTGFDSSKRAVLTVTAQYKNTTAEFEVKILKKGSSTGTTTPDTITVYFKLLGDYHHEYEDDPTLIHTFKKGNLELWLDKEAYTVDLNATVADLLKEVEKKHSNVSFSNPKGNWVDAVTFNGNTMTQLDNTDNSGWQYNVNMKHTELLVSQYFLENNDSVIWYWTDDYTQDMGSEGYDNSGNQLGGGGGGAAVDTKYTAADVKDLIDKIGTVTKDSKKAIEKAREAYDSLTAAQKKNVTNYDKLTAAEKAYTELTGEKIDTAKLPFTDVAKGSWYYDAIKAVYDKGLMNGESETKFMPNNKLSRAMLVTILYRMQNEPAVSTNALFNDVADGQWYTKAVAWASANNVVNGVGDGKFAPNDSVTRQEMAAMLYRYAKATGMDTTATASLNGFKDSAKVADWATDAMKWAVGSGLMKGNDDNTINPNGTATRAEVATVIIRLLSK